MATAKYPTINITSEVNDAFITSSDDDEVSSPENSMDYNLNADRSTDIEDLNSHISNVSDRSCSVSGLAPMLAAVTIDKRGCNALTQPIESGRDMDVTDVEDYDESDSEEQCQSKIIPELKLSLQEYLEHATEEHAHVHDEREEVAVLAGDFLHSQNLNCVSGYSTECEDYLTDLEFEESGVKSACEGLSAAIDYQGKICIADNTVPGKSSQESDKDDDVSAISDISDVVSAISDAAATGVRGMSEDEMLDISVDEEVCHISYSGSSSDSVEAHYGNDKHNNNDNNFPIIDVTFMKTRVDRSTSSEYMSSAIPKIRSFLDITAVNEEALTDIEKLDDSASEDKSFGSDNGSDSPIPHAIILQADEDSTICLTDIEDIIWEEDISLLGIKSFEAPSVSPSILPAPQREFVVLKEDKYGDTITSMEPLDNEYKFGIYNYKEDLPTDTEEFSCAEDINQSPSINIEAIATNNLIEDEVTVANEVLKHATNKRSELHSNSESVTDVEEIYVDGINRRKKIKARCCGSHNVLVPNNNKSKLLEVRQDREKGTVDIEGTDLYECSVQQQSVTDCQQQHQQQHVLSTAPVVQDIIHNVVGCNDEMLHSANSVVYIEKDISQIRKSTENSELINETKSNAFIKQLDSQTDSTQQQQQKQQGVKEKQVPSNVGEVQNPVSTDNNSDINGCTDRELNCLLNESVTVVHDQNMSSFDADAEKLHTKDRRDVRDAHTDVEYLESDESASRKNLKTLNLKI